MAKSANDEDFAFQEGRERRISLRPAGRRQRDPRTGLTDWESQGTNGGAASAATLSQLWPAADVALRCSAAPPGAR